ncbi:MAG: hypothetical protein ACI97N_001829 [Cognaticolwellia sp.]|jgi:hypothetical protein
MKSTILFLFCFFITTSTLAQLIIDGTIRPRTEYRDGFTKLSTTSDKPAFFVSQQTRLGLKLTTGKLSGRFNFQEARIWGGDNSLSLYEAWAKYNLSNNLAIKFGRQELHYDEGRLISKRPRRQDGWNYDALVFKYAKDSLYADIGFSVNNSQANVTGNNYSYAPTRFKAFHFLYLKKYFDNGLNISITGITSGFQKENTDTTFYKQTIGTKIDYRKNDFSTSFEGFHQSGKHKDGRSVNAYLLSGKVAYQLRPKVKLTLATEIVSGSDATNTNIAYQNTMHTFDILQGARFRYFGQMNYFRNLEKDTGGGGLINYYAKLNLKLHPQLQTIFTYHYFDFQNNVFNNNAEILDKHLASEIDVMLKYKHRKNINLALGYSLLTPSNSLESIQNISTGNSESGHYLWLMATVKFNYTTE